MRTNSTVNQSVQFRLFSEEQVEELRRAALLTIEYTGLDVYHEESQGPRLRYFFDDVCERIVGIYCRDLARKAKPRQAIRYYRKAAQIDMSSAARSQIYKKIAERYVDMDQPNEARRILMKAFDINPRMRGAARICEKLNVPYPPAAAGATKAARAD